MTSTTKSEVRSLSTIAREIAADWPKATAVGSGPFGAGTHPAQPYLSAMRSLDSLSDSYGYDDATSVVLYFLSNSSGWRGDVAKRVKAELKAMLKAHKR